MRPTVTRNTQVLESGSDPLSYFPDSSHVMDGCSYLFLRSTHVPGRPDSAIVQITFMIRTDVEVKDGERLDLDSLNDMVREAVHAALQRLGTAGSA